MKEDPLYDVRGDLKYGDGLEREGFSTGRQFGGCVRSIRERAAEGYWGSEW